MNNDYCEWEGSCETCPIEVDECIYYWNGQQGERRVTINDLPADGETACLSQPKIEAH